MAKNALLKAEALSPGNADISTLLEEVNKTELAGRKAE